MVNMSLHIEMDLMDDAMRAIKLIYETCLPRVDVKATAMEMKIERMMDGPAPMFDVRRLDDERVVAIPPKIWRDLIDEARELGLV